MIIFENDSSDGNSTNAKNQYTPKTDTATNNKVKLIIETILLKFRKLLFSNFVNNNPAVLIMESIIIIIEVTPIICI